MDTLNNVPYNDLEDFDKAIEMMQENYFRGSVILDKEDSETIFELLRRGKTRSDNFNKLATSVQGRDIAVSQSLDEVEALMWNLEERTKNIKSLIKMFTP